MQIAWLDDGAAAFDSSDARAMRAKQVFVLPDCSYENSYSTSVPGTLIAHRHAMSTGYRVRVFTIPSTQNIRIRTSTHTDGGLPRVMHRVMRRVAYPYQNRDTRTHTEHSTKDPLAAEPAEHGSLRGQSFPSRPGSCRGDA